MNVPAAPYFHLIQASLNQFHPRRNKMRRDADYSAGAAVARGRRVCGTPPQIATWPSDLQTSRPRNTITSSDLSHLSLRLPLTKPRTQ